MDYPLDSQSRIHQELRKIQEMWNGTQDDGFSDRDLEQYNVAITEAWYHAFEFGQNQTFPWFFSAMAVRFVSLWKFRSSCSAAGSAPNALFISAR